MTLGQRIQDLRKQRSLSQEALGEALGVSRQAVSKWEGDNGIPELDTLIAMSRLFGVTVGQLLGLEEASQSGESRNDKTEEEKLESILRRYAEESASRKGSWFKRWGVDVSALIVLLTAFVVLFSLIFSLRSTVRLLQSDMSFLQVEMSNIQNNLSWQIRETIYAVMAEEAELLSTFDWALVDCDLKNETVTISLKASMKEYSAGSRLQFYAKWKKVDGGEGQTNGEWVDGPDFHTELTLPMNYETELRMRVEDRDGNIQEQLVSAMYELHPDNFHLYAYNLRSLFAISVKKAGVFHSTAMAEHVGVDIVSVFPESFYPVEAQVRASLNGSEILRENMSIEAGGDRGIYRASIEDDYVALTLKEGDALDICLLVKDNHGRWEQFDENLQIVDGWAESAEAATPAIVMPSQ